VFRAAEAAALWAGWRTEQHQATCEIERLQSEATDINAVPLADLQGPIRRMPGLECLLIDGGIQLRGGGGEAAPAGSLLAAAYGSDDAHAAVGSVDSNLDRSLEELVVEAILDGEWLQGEGTPRRFSEEWRKVNGIEGRRQCRRFAFHELRLRRSSSCGSGEDGNHGGWHESVERPAIPRHLANESARGGGVFGCCHQEGGFNLWCE